MGCCKSCDDGKECEGGGGAGWRRMSPPDGSFAAPAELGTHMLSLAESPKAGVWFTLEPGAPAEVAWKLSLATAEATVSQTYEMGECNSVRVDVVTFSLQAFSIAGTKYAEIRVESSIDRENWRPESSTTVSAAGYVSIPVRGVSGRFIRLRYAGGSDNSFKCVMAVTLMGTHGPRWGRTRSGAA